MSVLKLKLNLQKFGHFQQKCGKKTIGMVCLGNIHIVCLVPVTFGNFSNLQKRAKLKMFRHVPNLAQ